MPIEAPDGWTLGSLCAIDTEPREWTLEEQLVLEDYAMVVTAILLHEGKWSIVRVPADELLDPRGRRA